ncbi:prepilin-type N-terminal cleavage/methylation domain-containing protein [Acidovorax sp. JG5]|uniref:PilW family protein n=1 Tax=Acidovorax sp. JG5 TaxID=2822718 RepID=UPI001B32D938|nr:prepilin-type N-terminal cleavage/methylation domain-containing protein [Acidovorax sp. JG5]MBP3981811.1 prepilin-type N-terminal cleavage/methylation domain-containing protein [Acidovorax sp. JG5]
MPLPSPATPRQRGVTLISLMTGLVISMILVLATLMLFQRMVRATTAARSDAQADTQRSAAFLAAGIAAQEAGYGINAAQAGTHLMVLTGAALAGSALSGTPAALGATGNAVVWAENTTGTPRCSALLAPNGSGQGGLRKLGPVACADATTFSGLAWTALPLSDTPATPVVIAWQAAACTPFGISAGTAAQKVLLILSADNSNGVALETSQCLSNVSAP